MDDYKPLYIQLKETILQRIKDGEYLPGEKIPSEREMASIYKINRMTVKHAINSLVDEGVLYKVGNAGTFVTKGKPKPQLLFNDNNLNDCTGLTAFIREKGYELENDILKKGVLCNKLYLESKLNLKPGEKVYALHRLRKIEGESIILEYCYIPLKYFEDIDNHDFQRASLYSYMESKNHKPVKYAQKMYIQKAKWPVDKIMKIDTDSPLYIMEAVGIDQQGNTVEYSISKIRCDKVLYTFEIGIN